MTIRTWFLSALAGLALHAQLPEGFHAGASLTLGAGLGLQETFTHRNLGGAGLEVGYTGRLAATTVPFRTTLTWFRFPGATETRNDLLTAYRSGAPSNTSGTQLRYGTMDHRNSLQGLQLSGDLYTEVPGVAGLYLVTGGSLNRWIEDQTLTWANTDGVLVWAGLDDKRNVISRKPEVGEVAYRHKGAIPGLKLGVRAGLEYAVQRRLVASVLFQVAELGTTPLGTRPLNPSWVQVGARWHF